MLQTRREEMLETLPIGSRYVRPGDYAKTRRRLARQARKLTQMPGAVVCGPVAAHGGMRAVDHFAAENGWTLSVLDDEWELRPPHGG